jgi:hypothetical protein
MTLTRIRSFFEDTSGAAMVEAGFALPIVLLVTLGALLWGLTIWQQITLQQAVEIEARCSMLPLLGSSTVTPLCGYINCTSGQTCAQQNAFGMGTQAADFANPTLPTSGVQFCTSITNYSNKYTIALIPVIPSTLRAQYCRFMQ